MQKNYAKIVKQWHEPTRREWYVLVYPSGEKALFIDEKRAEQERNAWNENNLRIGGVREK